MGLQLFTNRKWEDDSFNETNVKSLLADSYRAYLNRIQINNKKLIKEYNYKNLSMMNNNLK